jgi:hypothetical protein
MGYVRIAPYLESVLGERPNFYAQTFQQADMQCVRKQEEAGLFCVVSTTDLFTCSYREEKMLCVYINSFSAYAYVSLLDNGP